MKSLVTFINESRKRSIHLEYETTWNDFWKVRLDLSEDVEVNKKEFKRVEEEENHLDPGTLLKSKDKTYSIDEICKNFLNNEKIIIKFDLDDWYSSDIVWTIEADGATYTSEEDASALEGLYGDAHEGIIKYLKRNKSMFKFIKNK